MVRRHLLFAAAAVIVLAVAPRAQTKRFISEKDLFKFTWIADPNISPDGSTVAFVRVTVNEKENRYESSLNVVAADGSAPPRRLTSGIRDTAPRWSPDGTHLAFVRSIDKDGKPAPSQIYLLAWTIYGVLAGIAGVLLASFLGVSTNNTGQLTASAFSIVVLGGLGSVSGSLMAAYVVGYLETITAYLIAPTLRPLPALLLLVLVVYVRPQGFLGRR